jgi:hypothetical protein
MNLAIGAVDKEKIPRRTAPASVLSLETFAHELSERYQPRAFIASRADLALAYQTPGQMNTYYGGPRIEISPEVNFNEYFFATALRSQSRSQAAVARPSRTETLVIERLFHRLFSRQIRAPQFHAPAPEVTDQIRLPQFGVPGENLAKRSVANSEQASLHSVAMQATRADRVLARPFSAQLQEAEPPASKTLPSRTQDSGWGTPIATRDSIRPVSLSAPEIQRVTQQVIREMDHQFRARRERTGRIAR